LNTKDKTYLSKTADFSNRLPIKVLSKDLISRPWFKKAAWILLLTDCKGIFTWLLVDLL